MKKEYQSDYYDSMYSESVDYALSYKDSYYYVHWTQVIYYLQRYLDHLPEKRILEIGCGTGQLAEYLNAEGFTEYLGFDFSGHAIEIAKERVPDFDFFKGNALHSESFQHNFNVAICLEVLEHVTNDLQILDHLAEGTDIIFSVPNFDSESHVRWFTSERQVKSRYYRHIDFNRITRVGNIYICLGKVKPFKPSPLQKILKTREDIGLSSFTARIKFKFKNWLKLKSI